jgi:hypothetical protein
VTDKTTPQKISDVNQEDTKDTSGDQGKLSGQDIFDAKFHRLMDVFGEACEEEGIEVAIAIAMFPPLVEVVGEENAKEMGEKNTSPFHPMVFYRGHLADVAALQASVLRGMKAELINALRTD